MNRKAFTLVELIAVIVVLGVLLSITTLAVTTYLNQTKETSFNSLVEAIESSTEMYVLDHSSQFPQLDIVGSNFDIEVNDLVTNNYISDNVIDQRSGEAIPLTTKIRITVVAKDEITVDFMYE
jgi:prepilin-type N-terminal cleavage/methylation domain-containing protein